MTLANGYGNAKDWIAVAATGAADRTYMQWTYVGTGVTTRTWTTTMPTAAGTYEFRLFLNDGFTRGGHESHHHRRSVAATRTLRDVAFANERQRRWTRV